MVCMRASMSVKSFLLNLFLSLGLMCASFYLAWQISAATNFLYSFWYEVIEINQTIKTFAPNNKNKQGFELTEKQQQVELFAGIVSGVQNKGKGLDELQYKNPSGKVSDTLLTDAEIIHLQDVANLVHRFKFLAIGGCITALLAFFLMYLATIKLAAIRYHFLVCVGFVTILVILVLLIGPTKIFYAGHELIFPNNHQWFFYYEDSLMSTMMKAPTLFGPIACQLLVFTIVVWWLLLMGMRVARNNDK